MKVTFLLLFTCCGFFTYNASACLIIKNSRSINKQLHFTQNNVGQGFADIILPSKPTKNKLAPPIKKHKIHLFLLIGQSNMLGRDTNGIGSQQTDPRILCLDRFGNRTVAKEPMAVGGSGIGPGISFAKEMLKKNPKDTIILIPCAVGGTPLKRWVKSADLYENAVRKAKYAMEGKYEIEGVLWHQGESDSTDPIDAQTYGDRLTQMFKDLRKDLGQPNLPIVVGQLGKFVNYPNITVVTTALKEMPNKLSFVGFADSNDLTDKGDQLHFNSSSQREFGVRYAKAMNIILKQLPPK